MDHAALALLGHQNWIDYLAASVSQSADGLLVRDRGVVAALGHVPLAFFNQILVERPDVDFQALADAVAQARRREDPFVVSLREGVDDGLAPFVSQLGLVASQESATLAMTLFPLGGRGTARHTAPGFEIRRIFDEAGLADHRHAVTAGFATDPRVAVAMMPTGILDRPGCSIYVGYLQEQPVAAGIGWRTGRTIGVYNIATVPSARRRGFGEAMTSRVLADGEAAGCDVAALEASAMGRPIYERLGFRVTQWYVGYRP